MEIVQGKTKLTLTWEQPGVLLLSVLVQDPGRDRYIRSESLTVSGDDLKRMQTFLNGAWWDGETPPAA